MVSMTGPVSWATSVGLCSAMGFRYWDDTCGGAEACGGGESCGGGASEVGEGVACGGDDGSEGGGDASGWLRGVCWLWTSCGLASIVGGEAFAFGVVDGGEVPLVVANGVAVLWVSAGASSAGASSASSSEPERFCGA